MRQEGYTHTAMADGLQSIDTWRPSLCPNEIVVSQNTPVAAIQAHHAYTTSIEDGSMHRSAGLEHRAVYNLELVQHIRALLFRYIMEQTTQDRLPKTFTPASLASYVVASDPDMPHWPSVDSLCQTLDNAQTTTTSQAMDQSQMAAHNLGQAFVGAYHYTQGFLAQAALEQATPSQHFSDAA